MNKKSIFILLLMVSIGMLFFVLGNMVFCWTRDTSSDHWNIFLLGSMISVLGSAFLYQECQD